MTPDTRKHHVGLIEKWVEAHDDLEAVIASLSAIVGDTEESPLNNAIWSAFRSYTAALAEILGDDADGGWLEWFAFECGFGRKPMEMTFSDGEVLLVVGPSDLLAAIQCNEDGTRKHY